MKVNLNSSLFPVLEYRCPPPTHTQLQLRENSFKNKLQRGSQEGLRNLGVPHLYSRTGNKEEFKLTFIRKCQFNLSISCLKYNYHENLSIGPLYVKTFLLVLCMYLFCRVKTDSLQEKIALKLKWAKQIWASFQNNLNILILLIMLKNKNSMYSTIRVWTKCKRN